MKNRKRFYISLAALCALAPIHGQEPNASGSNKWAEMTKKIVRMSTTAVTLTGIGYALTQYNETISSSLSYLLHPEYFDSVYLFEGIKIAGNAGVSAGMGYVVDLVHYVTSPITRNLPKYHLNKKMAATIAGICFIVLYGPTVISYVFDDPSVANQIEQIYESIRLKGATPVDFTRACIEAIISKVGFSSLNNCVRR